MLNGFAPHPPPFQIARLKIGPDYPSQRTFTEKSSQTRFRLEIGDTFRAVADRCGASARDTVVALSHPLLVHQPPPLAFILPKATCSMDTARSYPARTAEQTRRMYMGLPREVCFGDEVHLIRVAGVGLLRRGTQYYACIGHWHSYDFIRNCRGLLQAANRVAKGRYTVTIVHCASSFP